MKNFKVKVESAPNDTLNVYLVDCHGISQFVQVRRRNALLYKMLKNGLTLNQLRVYKPNRSKHAQKTYNTIKHLVKVVEEYIRFELDDTAS